MRVGLTADAIQRMSLPDGQYVPRNGTTGENLAAMLDDLSYQSH